jgi:predicted transcriptional regulator
MQKRMMEEKLLVQLLKNIVKKPLSYSKSGECKTYKKIAATLGIHRNTISEWIRK